MTRVSRMFLVSLVLAVPTVLLAADPPAGSYKVVLPLQGNRALWLLKLEAKGDTWTGEAKAGPDVIPAKVEGIKVEKGTLQFSLNLGKGAFNFEGRVPTGKDAKIYGTVAMKGEVNPVILEPTTLTSLDPFEVSKEVLAKTTEGPEVTQAALVCLSNAEAKKAKPDDAKVWADKALKAAEPFGPKWKRTVVMEIAEILGGQEGFTGLALEYAQQAKNSLDAASDNPALQKRVLTLLADALDKAGKKEDAKKVREDSEKLSSVVARTFAARKGKSDRVVLVELFTCAQSPACVAPDLAFGALTTTYKPTEVVLLQYHLNTPEPDPLSNAESEARAKFYETARATPAIFFNGGKSTAGAGGNAESQAIYDQYTEALAELLEKPTKIKLTASATRKGNKIEIKTDVADLAETGPDIRLRVALVEQEIAYVGGNKLPKHVQVVRHFPNGAAGTAMKAKSATETYSVDLDLLTKNLKAYLDKTNEAKPFPTKERPLDLKKLRVVAFVQNDETGEVLNAVQVDVKGE